jgi:hypothetical protein
MHFVMYISLWVQHLLEMRLMMMMMMTHDELDGLELFVYVGSLEGVGEELVLARDLLLVLLLVAAVVIVTEVVDVLPRTDKKTRSVRQGPPISCVCVCKKTRST